MKGLLKNIFRGQKGISLVEVMIAAGVMGGVTLMLTNVMKTTNVVQKTADANTQYMQTLAQIQSLVQNETFCGENFTNPPQIVRMNEFRAFTELKGAKGRQILKAGTMLGGTRLRINSMGLQRNANETLFVINFEKVADVGKKAESVSGGQLITKSFPINAEYDEADTIKSCKSDVRNHIEEATNEAIEQMCGKGGDKRLVYNPDTKTCEALAQFGDGEECADSGHALQKVGYINNGELTYKFECVATYAIPDCGPGEFLRRDENANPGEEGEYTCAKNTCGPNEVFTGFDASGNTQCFRCNNGSIPVYTNAREWACEDLSCKPAAGGPPVYMAGIDSNGKPICRNLIEGDNDCPQGGQLAVNANGAVTFQCCQAICADAHLKCQGHTYEASNGCGFCTGTKAADCSDSNMYCSTVTYKSKDGCGICTGTRGIEAPQWVGWEATNDWRDKPGTACLASGTIPTQRKYKGICNADTTCGSATCTGPSEQWRDEGSRDCTPTTSCSSSCDCPNSFDVCESGRCVRRESGCLSGTYAKGDSSCQWICQGGYWACPIDVGPCGGGSGGGFSGGASGGLILTGGSQGGSSGGSSGGCFVAGTQIQMFNGELKNIEDIQVGDELLDGNKKKVTVQELIPLDYEGAIYSINGGGYFFTPNHPFLSLTGWKSLDPMTSMKEAPDLKVKLLKVGDILVKKDGLEVVYSLDSIETNEKVYNFELDGSHEYIADEYVVHNKRACPHCEIGTYSYKCPGDLCEQCIPDGQPAPHCR